MHGAVSRLQGSPTIAVDGSLGNCRWTASVSRLLVTMSVRSGGMSPWSLPTVSCKSVSEPASGNSCFGSFARLDGQKRVPDPPAIMIA